MIRTPLTDRIDAWQVLAGVTTGRAPVSRASLGGSVSNLVAYSTATALESMVKPNPVSNFVSESLKAIGDQ